jgi:large conductance mechanosensitive channel
MSMMEEFKAFAMKGNVVDLAVGVIIGAAFGKIVDSIVGDLIMPIVGLLTGGADFSKYFWVLGANPDKLANLADLKKAGVATVAYGNFATIVVNFLILAFIIFMMVKAMNKAKKAAEPPPAPTPEDILLLREIRDGLKK